MKNACSRALPYCVMLSIAGTSMARADYPLFNAFPELESRIPRVELVHGATPIEPLTGLENHLQSMEPAKSLSGRLWVKRDDRSSEPLGGNKARKLELLLADARLNHAELLVTSGMYGSNHAYTTALAARELGLKTRLILGPQPVTESVKQKLLSMHALGADLAYHGAKLGMGLDMLGYMLAHAFSKKRGVYYIPPGGSSDIGSVGYANAFFELLEQTGPGDLPDDIVVAVGTGGTTAGLLAGICLAGLQDRVRVHAVTTVAGWLYGERKLRKDARKLFAGIRSKLDPGTRARIPECDFRRSPMLEFIREYFPPQYGEATPAIHKTISLLKQTDQLILEPTYTGKAMQHVIDLTRDINTEKPRKILFWHTYNSYDLSRIINNHDWTEPSAPWKDLPPRFHKLFR